MYYRAVFPLFHLFQLRTFHLYRVVESGKRENGYTWIRFDFAGIFVDVNLTQKEVVFPYPESV
jgi:hypothetical protein